MAETSIEWATHSWNPVTGCDRVSPGCAHCYALDLAARLKGMGQPKYQRDGGRASGPGFGVTLHPETLAEPARWRKPRRVFVNSMSDLFHPEVPVGFIAGVWEVMTLAPQHDFLILTKRPERMAQVVEQLLRRGDGPGGPYYWEPPPNVWLGVSIENRRYVGRADVLRATPAAVRFISAEPLLGPLLAAGGAFPADGLEWEDGHVGPELDLAGIDWLIVGGESGSDHRPMRAEWARDLRDACLARGCECDRDERPVVNCWSCTGEKRPAFFFKQWGGRTPKAGGRLLDGRTWDEFPQTRKAVAA